jgi:hypothetical protein
MNYRVLVAVMGLGCAMILTPFVAAEDDHSGHAHSREEQVGAQAASDATQGSCERCAQSVKDLDDVLAKLDKAKQSNDVGELRATLNDIQAPLTQLKEHLATCQMKMGKAGKMCPMCKVKLDKDGRCPQCGMQM